MALGHRMRVPVGDSLLGRVIDGLGQPLDNHGPLRTRHTVELATNGLSAMRRPRITEIMRTRQRVIDGLLTIGCGQRMGLFAGSGVGKSTLLGEIARGAESDVNVIALIGERGREVRPFLDDCLGPEGLARSVVIVSTSDDPPLMRLRAAQAAATIAGHFRSRGQHVLMLLDSLTRLATAQREIGLLLGEPPTARGYPPSVFQIMANLLEQLGCTEQGSITGILTVLVDGDDLDEPVADAARSILDGHIVLSRRLAERGHFPSIDVLASISRLFSEIADDQQQAAALAIRGLLATHAETEDLIRIGAYSRGSSSEIDRAIDLRPHILALLQQNIGEFTSLDDTRKAMQHIASMAT